MYSIYFENLLSTYEPELEVMAKFKTGKLVVSKSVKGLMEESTDFANEIRAAYSSYIQGDWGEKAPLNSKGKPYGIRNGERLFGVYETTHGDVFITTESNRSVTTILFPKEY